MAATTTPVPGDGVDLRHLRTLLALRAEGTFTDAAIALGVSQAAVTRTIQRLEAATGLSLVRRTNRGAHLTPAGQDLAAGAADVLARFDALWTRPARITVGCPWAGFGARTAAVHAAWASRCPGVDLALVQVDTPTSGVVEGRTDAALLRVGSARGLPHGLVDDVVGTERRLAALARTHPLASRRRVRLADLAAHPVAVNRRTGTTDESLFATPVVTVETLDTDHWLDTISLGGAVGLTSEATAHRYAAPGVRFVPVADAPPLTVHLVRRRGDGRPLLDALVDVVREVYAAG